MSEAYRPRSRALDWACTAMMLGWGLTLLAPGNTFATSPAYADLLRIAPEDIWGAFLVVTGVVRLGALLVNGYMREGAPLLRCVTACFGVVIWVQFTLAFAAVSAVGGALSAGIAIHLVLAGADFYSAARAGSDVIHARRARAPVAR